MKLNKKIIFIGAGGHANVLLDALTDGDIIGFTEITSKTSFNNLKNIGDDDSILRFKNNEVLLINGIGSTSIPKKRKIIFENFKEKGYEFLTVIHPSVVTGKKVYIGEGAQIMAGSVIQVNVSIGINTIINTSSSIDHDCIIGKHSHIAPGCILSGNVEIGENTHIGTGTVIIQSIEIGSNCLIGAGSVVVTNIPSNSKAYGNPCKVIS
jgi:sugar O-acyltransferase (sialic acid O-acetyltransferase NeuD family)